MRPESRLSLAKEGKDSDSDAQKQEDGPWKVEAHRASLLLIALLLIAN